MRGVFLPEPDYRKMRDTVISGIKTHGKKATFGTSESTFWTASRVTSNIMPTPTTTMRKASRQRRLFPLVDILKGVKVTEASDNTSTEHPGRPQFPRKSPRLPQENIFLAHDSNPSILTASAMKIRDLAKYLSVLIAILFLGGVLCLSYTCRIEPYRLASLSR